MTGSVAATMSGPSAVTASGLAGLRSEVRGFLDDEIACGRITPACDSWMSGCDPGFSRRVAERGWLGMTMPVEYGGAGRSPLERFVVAEEMLAAGAPVAAHWIADRQMAPSILAHGTDAQRRRYIPGIASGTTFFAIGMSEPDAGSDLAGIRTRATEVDGGWRISGTKVWTTQAHNSHAMVVLARTDGEAGDRQKGLSQFIVDLPHPDIEIRPIRSIDGEAHFNEVIFDDAVLAHDALLGVRGEGWSQVMGELAYERSGPERYLSTMPLLRAWADELRRNGATESQRRTLGALTARARALRQMSWSVAAELADGRTPDTFAAMVKDIGSMFESDVLEAIRSASGANARRSGGNRFETLLAGAVLHTPAFTLRGGTNEILRGIVARGLGTR